MPVVRIHCFLDCDLRGFFPSKRLPIKEHPPSVFRSWLSGDLLSLGKMYNHGSWLRSNLSQGYGLCSPSVSCYKVLATRWTVFYDQIHHLWGLPWLRVNMCVCAHAHTCVCICVYYELSIRSFCFISFIFQVIKYTVPIFVDLRNYFRGSRNYNNLQTCIFGTQAWEGTIDLSWSLGRRLGLLSLPVTFI